MPEANERPMSRAGRTSGNHWENCRAHFDRGERNPTYDGFLSQR